MDRVSLKMGTALPLGLVLNELVSNSLKYAFPNGKRGEIRIELKERIGETANLRTGEEAGERSSTRQLIFTVSDNGIGFPEQIDFTNTKSLGMQLVVALAEQLEGTIELGREQGTSFRIDFAEED